VPEFLSSTAMRGRPLSVSLLHEALVELLERRPDLLLPLVTAAGLSLPPFAALRVTSGELRQLVPVEARADGVVLLLDGRGDPAFALVVEVQLGRDEAKLYSWPLYQAAARARHRCPAAVAVLTPDAAVAAWAALPRGTGQPGASFAPVVLGPGALPRVTDPRADPHLALLSALAHGNGPGGAEVAAAALAAAAGLPEDEAAMLGEVLWASLGEAARRALEAQMDITKWKEQSALYREGEARGRAEGEARGRAEGEARGRAEGEAHGRAEGLRAAVVDLCEVLGLAVSPERQARLDAMSAAELEALRLALKRHRGWPEEPR
jgi:hypothetical protein